MSDPAGESRGASSPRREAGLGVGNTSPRVALFAAAIFASAFLIFLVQPMVGKRILPWFGGVPAVWALCLAFYQSMLFIGYAYADLLIRFAAPKRQPWIHSIVIAAALVSLPVLPADPPSDVNAQDPSAAVLRILVANVAFPFLALASTGPLVQAWFARALPRLSPYPLYAVSNLGSLLALFAYPLAIEPHLTLTATGTLWSGALAATAIVVLACALMQSRSMGLAPDSEPTAGPERHGFVRVATWVLASGTAVVVLMGITNKLCLDVASIPFLWTLPLATYLTTFIVCFSWEGAYRRPLFMAASLAAYALTRNVGLTDPIAHQVVAYCGLLFTTCMILHGELYRSRPAPRSLTTFYLCVSAGGALGGLFVGLVAPRAFGDYYELPVGLSLTAAIVFAASILDPRSPSSAHGRRVRWGTVVACLIALVGFALWSRSPGDPHQLHKERSFFGVLTVFEVPSASDSQVSLRNGTTLHGAQFRDRAARRIPTRYYGRATGVGLALASRDARAHSRIGVIGLGVGTLATYGRAGDTFRFYEIDPVVVRIARDDGYFSFLADSPAKVEIVLGDARRSLVDEQRRGDRQRFDFLVIDAFSSDSIPVHLITREAFECYFAALTDDGLIAVHTSNRHFDLVSVVSRIAAELGGHTLQILTQAVPELQSSRAEWVVIARDADQLSRLETRIETRRGRLRMPPDALDIRRGDAIDLKAFPLWTDDYSDVLSVLRRESGAEARYEPIARADG